MEIKIGNTLVGDNHPCFIVGELSGNHRGKFEIAKASLEEMKKAGVTAAKIQTLKPGSITLNSDREDFVIGGGTLWDGMRLFDLYSEIETPFEWVEPLMNLSAELGMEFFSSPFGHEEVEFLAARGISAYKIASFEITDIPLIEHAASMGKPIIMSTGVAEKSDIELAVDACRRMGNNDIILLKCTSSYPTPPEEANLAMIPQIRQDFKCLAGLSDHTLDILAPVVAVTLGACLVEKHFILDKKLGGPDAEFSLDPADWKAMTDAVRMAEKMKGTIGYDLSPKVKKSRLLARSLYVAEDVDAGAEITAVNVRSVRPGYGLHPSRLKDFIGKRFARAVKAGERFTDSLVE